MIIRIEKKLEDWYGVQDLSYLDDNQIIEIILEDTVSLLDSARWTVVREDPEEQQRTEGE